VINYSRHMHQDFTYWALDSVNENNEGTFSAPVSFKCRWQDTNNLTRAANGQEFISAAVIYTASAVALKGYVKKGASSELDPVGLDGAFEIRNISESPNLSGTISLQKVTV
jgi:hypothetical protein